ncbi:hypothetical protein RHSIM_Rhsim02G0253700 [Rhododendron simsii]|uniref:Uncharacterized protein n=1 Tax=Rhododendron simsii TaxID=118357 RepID=A0A834LZE1_RHOSS|nr:hypothetical protein RHSIM_Rhsim02G0253700 [Rhododendron simsii]
MNSIFSSLDAVCAEILGQSVRASLKPSAWSKCDGGVKSHQQSREIKTTENNSGAAARFAPELDGLNCFETLVSF